MLIYSLGTEISYVLNELKENQSRIRVGGNLLANIYTLFSNWGNNVIVNKPTVIQLKTRY